VTTNLLIAVSLATVLVGLAVGGCGARA